MTLNYNIHQNFKKKIQIDAYRLLKFDYEEGFSLYPYPIWIFPRFSLGNLSFMLYGSFPYRAII